MIVLRVEDYCHSCSDFEADVDTKEYGFVAEMHEPIHNIVTRVRCKHRDRCAAKNSSEDC